MNLFIIYLTTNYLNSLAWLVKVVISGTSELIQCGTLINSTCIKRTQSFPFEISSSYTKRIEDIIFFLISSSLQHSVIMKTRQVKLKEHQKRRKNKCFVTWAGFATLPSYFPTNLMMP